MGEIVVNERAYKVKPVLAEDFVLLQARLLKTIGPGISELTDLLEGNVTKMMQAKVAMNGLCKIFKDCDPKEVKNLIKDLVELCEVKRTSGVYGDVIMNSDFAGGKMNDLFQVLFFVLKDVFGELFTELQAAGKEGLENMN